MDISREPSFSWTGDDFQGSADGCKTLFHVAKADASTRVVVDATDIEPTAIIENNQAYAFRVKNEAQLYPVSAFGMLLNIGKSFLCHPEQNGIDFIG